MKCPVNGHAGLMWTYKRRIKIGRSLSDSGVRCGEAGRFGLRRGEFGDLPYFRSRCAAIVMVSITHHSGALGVLVGSYSPVAGRKGCECRFPQRTCPRCRLFIRPSVPLSFFLIVELGIVWQSVRHWYLSEKQLSGAKIRLES